MSQGDEIHVLHNYNILEDSFAIIILISLL